MGFGNVAAERRQLETTYEDSATVYRSLALPVGSIDRVSRESVLRDLPCGLSHRGDSSRQSGPQQDVRYDCVLFLAPEWEILPGDEVAVSRFGAAQTFAVVGRPVHYATHQEVFLKGRDLA